MTKEKFTVQATRLSRAAILRSTSITPVLQNVRGLQITYIVDFRYTRYNHMSRATEQRPPVFLKADVC